MGINTGLHQKRLFMSRLRDSIQSFLARESLHKTSLWRSQSSLYLRQGSHCIIISYLHPTECSRSAMMMSSWCVLAYVHSMGGHRDVEMTYSLIEVNPKRLLFFLLVATFFSLGSGSSPLALDTTRTSTAVWRGKGKVDVFLRIETNHE